MVAAMTGTSFSPLFDLPPELREIIYGFIFISSSSPTATAILSERVPNSNALRQKSKLLLQESARIYDRATGHFDNQHKEKAYLTAAVWLIMRYETLHDCYMLLYYC